MSGRRSHVRFRVLQSPEGVLRVMRDVIVERAAAGGEVVVISREPAVVGDVLSVQVGLDEAAAGLRACVMESHPVVVDGGLRYRLRLREVREDHEVEEPVAAQ